MRVVVFRSLVFFLPRFVLWRSFFHWRDEVIAAMNPNTRRAYVGALNRLEAWLGRRWPSDAELARYVQHLAEAGRGVSTAEQTVSAIRYHARSHGKRDPVGPLSAASLKRVRRATVNRGRGQAPAATPGEVLTLLNTRTDRTPHANGRLESVGRVGKRCLAEGALIALLYMGALRVSEAAALRWNDVAVSDDGQGVHVWVRRSKGNPYGADSDVRHLKGAMAQALLRWREASGADKASGEPVFCGVTAATLSRRVKKVVMAAGLKRSLTAHSFRVGLAAELTRRGASLQEVMHAGGWKSPSMAAHYSAAARAEGGAVAKYL